MIRCVSAHPISQAVNLAWTVCCHSFEKCALMVPSIAFALNIRAPVFLYALKLSSRLVVLTVHVSGSLIVSPALPALLAHFKAATTPLLQAQVAMKLVIVLYITAIRATLLVANGSSAAILESGANSYLNLLDLANALLAMKAMFLALILCQAAPHMSALPLAYPWQNALLARPKLELTVPSTQLTFALAPLTSVDTFVRHLLNLAALIALPAKCHVTTFALVVQKHTRIGFVHCALISSLRLRIHFSVVITLEQLVPRQ